MKDRILQFLNKEKITATRLADQIGVQRSSISHILSGRNKPSFDFIEKLLNKYPDLNAEWLLLNKGDMYKGEDLVKEKVSGDQDLFRSPNKSIIKETSNKNTIEKTEYKPTFSEGIEKDHEKKFTNVKKVKKVLFFYEDGTFSEYNPQLDA